MDENNENMVTRPKPEATPESSQPPPSQLSTTRAASGRRLPFHIHHQHYDHVFVILVFSVFAASMRTGFLGDDTNSESTNSAIGANQFTDTGLGPVLLRALPAFW